MGEQFLTPQDKEKELKFWGGYKQQQDADEAITPYCDALNELYGICTLQSCAGHRPGEISSSAPKGTRDVWTIRGAHLWLWLDEELAKRFYGRAMELAQHPLMEKVSIRFQPYGQQLVELYFAGNDRGPRCLQLSMYVILDFFNKI